MSETMTVTWKGNMLFSATDSWGNELRADAGEPVGGSMSAPNPVTQLYFSIGACTGMDVVSILRKMKQEITSYEIEVVAERTRDEYPKPVDRVVVRHKLKGANLDPEQVEKAVRLSDEKYCTVIASLRIPAEVRSEVVIE